MNEATKNNVRKDLVDYIQRILLSGELEGEKATDLFSTLLGVVLNFGKYTTSYDAETFIKLFEKEVEDAIASTKTEWFHTNSEKAAEILKQMETCSCPRDHSVLRIGPKVEGGLESIQKDKPSKIVH